MTEWLATYLLHSTVVMCCVLLLGCTALRGSSARDVLLRAALLVPVFTAALTTLPHIPDSSIRPAPQIKISPPRLPTSSFEGSPAPSSAAAPEASRARNKAFRLSLPDRAPRWVTLLMVGSLAFAGFRFATAWWLLRSRLGGRIEQDRFGPHVQSVMGATRSPLEVQLCWADLSVPCALGRRWILLPPDIQQTLTSDELRAVLAHEYAHLLRRDPLWTVGLAFMTHLLWFQPLNWLALAAWRRASEEQCDAWAGGHTSRLTLAQALLKLARVRSQEGNLTQFMAMSAVHTTHLTDRIHALIHVKETPMKRYQLVLLASGPLVLGSLIPPLALATPPTPRRQVVVLDAAHGGEDPGAVGFAVEKEVTLQIARQVQQRLVKAGVQVIMTREGDRRPSLEERIKLATSPAQVYVSIGNAPGLTSSGVASVRR